MRVSCMKSLLTKLLLGIGTLLLASSTRLAIAAQSASQTAVKVDKLLVDNQGAVSQPAVKAAVKAAAPAESKATSRTDPKADSKTWKSVSATGYSHKADLPAAAIAKPADDETYLRRVSMDLIGLPPTPAEITAFALDPSSDKRAKAVDRLLARPEFGQNWGRYWRDVILYRRADDRAVLASAAIGDYLTDQFNKNVPWDQTARSFITATGDVRENGDTGIVMAQFGATPEITAEVARIFMAIQIQCAQCHDHPFDRWKRTQFHELAAFFPDRAQAGKTGRCSEAFVRSCRRRSGTGGESEECDDSPGEPRALHARSQRPDREGDADAAGVLCHRPEACAGATDAERRATIARWITSPQDEWFAKAFVNRIWSEMVGEGFYEPVDDIGPDRECNAPETLDYLAKQFVAHQYDVKWLYRTIAATSAYQLDSRSRHLPGQTPFLANCPQMLRADQVFDALVSALGIDNEKVARDGGGKKGAMVKSGMPADYSTSSSVTIRASGATRCRARFRKRWC